MWGEGASDLWGRLEDDEQEDGEIVVLKAASVRPRGAAGQSSGVDTEDSSDTDLPAA
jgi:hypothetical protein